MRFSNCVGPAFGRPGYARGFGHGISPDNLRITRDGAVQVLLADGAGLAAGLARLGNAVTATGNTCVSLAHTAPYPELKICPCRTYASNQQQNLNLCLGAWRPAWATQKRDDKSTRHFLAISGRDDIVSPQIVLTENSDVVEFESLAQNFQGVAAHASEGNNIPNGYLARFRQRKRTLIEQFKNGAKLVRADGLAELWSNALAEKLWLNTAALTAAAVQSVFWLPSILRHDQAGVLTATREDIFFRCATTGIVELWVVSLISEAGTFHSLEAYDENDDLLFTLTTLPQLNQFWVELLRRMRVV